MRFLGVDDPHGFRAKTYLGMDLDSGAGLLSQNTG